ncbi:uncharacterized protein BT62DRAFT_1011719 [Guyanagaster necrorhizus]|uniref:Uncharacterized protein n=1 Tax=Guyanagaster necrorhizus TaxID=856835 RepID=A0A9P8AMW5_9AGAR|nr:uncharacterized protein BT62DRAFT_1011719 [Guyanagaster necrorhizus MCA 3950]KAG7441305.1 hypothetical protein BT62DRAFT_1011719 [Guyanagaster necrorhizus MCA 3950]
MPNTSRRSQMLSSPTSRIISTRRMLVTMLQNEYIRALGQITNLEAAAAALSTRDDWYTLVFKRFTGVLSWTPSKESETRKLMNTNNLANSGTNPASSQFPGYASSIDTSSTRGSISPPTSAYDASSASLARSDRSVSLLDSWLQEGERIRQDGYIPTQRYILASSPTNPRAARSPTCRCRNVDLSPDNMVQE